MPKDTSHNPIPSGWEEWNDWFINWLPARTAICRYYNEGMHTIHLHPDVSYCNAHRHHRASSGILTANRTQTKIGRRYYSLPIGVTAYPWWAIKEELRHANRYALTLAVLLTVLLDPLMSLWQGRFKDIPYQLRMIVEVFLITLVIQPLYGLVWQCHHGFPLLRR